MDYELLFLGVAGGFVYSIYSAASKAFLKKRPAEPLRVLLYINVSQALITPLLWIVCRPVLPPLPGLHLLIISGIAGATGYAALYMALHCGDVSSVMPIMGSKVILAGLLAVPMLHESHSAQVYVAAALVAVSVAMLSYTPAKGNSQRFSVKPVILMLTCCTMFAFTDIFIKRTLAFIDSFNFLVYYNAIIGALSLAVIPYLRHRRVDMSLKAGDLQLCIISSASLAAASLLLVILFKLSEGVVIPNILMSSRGVFVVLISAAMSYRGSDMLDTQSRGVYAVRLVAAVLIMFSIGIALSR